LSKLSPIPKKRYALTSARRKSLLSSSTKPFSGSAIISSPKLRLGRQGAADVFFYLALASAALGLGLLAYEGVI
jgi:hypothetical protein